MCFDKSLFFEHKLCPDYAVPNKSRFFSVSSAGNALPGRLCLPNCPDLGFYSRPKVEAEPLRQCGPRQSLGPRENITRSVMTTLERMPHPRTYRVFALFHRSADLRFGAVDHHHVDRAAVAAVAAAGAVSAHRAADGAASLQLSRGQRQWTWRHRWRRRSSSRSTASKA